MKFKLGWAALLMVTWATAATGPEQYTYDARGRLRTVTYADGKTIEYLYDAAGNRRSSGPAVNRGQFTWVSGAHTNLGSSGDIATATIKNAGTGAITGITWTCVGGSFDELSGPTSIAAGATASFQCKAYASGSYSLTITLNSSAAINSPFSKSF